MKSSAALRRFCSTVLCPSTFSVLFHAITIRLAACSGCGSPDPRLWCVCVLLCGAQTFHAITVRSVTSCAFWFFVVEMSVRPQARGQVHVRRRGIPTQNQTARSSNPQTESQSTSSSLKFVDNQQPKPQARNTRLQSYLCRLSSYLRDTQRKFVFA